MLGSGLVHTLVIAALMAVSLAGVAPEQPVPVIPREATWASLAGVPRRGDVNDDMMVDSTDVLIVLSADVGFPVAQFCPMNCGDVNGDGIVDSTDALIILSYDVGFDVPFPVGVPVGCPELTTQPAGCVL